MRMRRRSTLAASFVVTVAMITSGCDDKPKSAINPPDKTSNPPGPDTTATPTAPGPAPTETTPATGASDTPPSPIRRGPIANPPAIMPAPDGGVIEQKEDGCFWSEKKGAPQRRVQCPQPK